MRTKSSENKKYIRRKFKMAKIDELLESIDALSVAELAELVKGIEEKYGVICSKQLQHQQLEQEQQQLKKNLHST